VTPERIQLRRIKGWWLKEGAVVVSRPTKWGNPFAVLARVAETEHQVWLTDLALGLHHGMRAWPSAEISVHTVKDQAEAVRLFRKWITFENDYFTPERLAELRGLDLACWCPIGSPCHADVLLELANS
jgi:hypothetical protein